MFYEDWSEWKEKNQCDINKNNNMKEITETAAAHNWPRNSAAVCLSNRLSVTNLYNRSMTTLKYD